MMRLGALEAGGTKMVCAIGDEKGNILEQISIKTTTPQETIPQIIAYFKEKGIEALGIGTFGPVDLNKDSKTYGYITSTPKLPWKDYNLLGTLKEALLVPMEIDTDVNGSVLGEVTFGCAQKLNCVIYITIGTGVGVGVFVNNSLLHGMLHPEAGHIMIQPKASDTFEGICPFHKNCFEGVASGPAIEAHYQKKAVELAEDQSVWELEAHYIAQALVNYIYTYAPQKIILGGGVMHQEQLFPLIRKEVAMLNKDYIKTKEMADLDTYIVPASLNDNQGIMGALELARIANGK